MILCKSYSAAAKKSNLIEPLNKRIKGNFSGRNESDTQDTFVLF
jgi:hypothetical protein